MLVTDVGDGCWWQMLVTDFGDQHPKSHQPQLVTNMYHNQSRCWTWTTELELELSCVKLEVLVTDLALWSSTYKWSREDLIIVTKITGVWLRTFKPDFAHSVKHKSVTNIYPRVKSKVDDSGSKWRSRRLEVENARILTQMTVYFDPKDLKDRPLLPSTVRFSTFELAVSFQDRLLLPFEPTLILQILTFVSVRWWLIFFFLRFPTVFQDKKTFTNDNRLSWIFRNYFRIFPS